MISFLADESVDAKIVLALRNDGFSIYYISEDCPELTDLEVMEKGLNQQLSINN